MGSLDKEPIQKLLEFYFQFFLGMEPETKVIMIGTILRKISKKTYNINKLVELSDQLNYQAKKIQLPKNTSSVDQALFLNRIKYYLNREGIEIKSLTIAITI